MSRMWDHQREAVNFAQNRRATLWHMGMGTGKSRCAIELAKRIGASKVLVLCPLSVCTGWEDQLARFGSDFRCVTLRKGSVKAKAEQARRALDQSHTVGGHIFVVVNYESAYREPLSRLLQAQGFDLLVMDESHRIKSPSGKTSRWVSRLAKTCKRKVALTGTPMPHSPLDVYAQFWAGTPTRRAGMSSTFPMRCIRRSAWT